MARKAKPLPNTQLSTVPIAVSKQKFSLLAIAVIYLLLACGYNAITPFGAAAQHNPDEHAHFLYVETVAAGHLPVFRAGAADYEAHQPPLYYGICAPVYLAAHSLGRAADVACVRSVSTAIGVALIFITYLIVIALLPEVPLIALACAAFVAWLPGVVSLNASITNDSLTILIIAAALLLLIRLAVCATNPDLQEPNLRTAVFLGVTLGLGIWTKTSTLLLFPTVAAALYFLARKGAVSASYGFKSGAIALSLGLLIGAPWLIRNQILYGDPIAQHIFVSAFTNTALAPDVARFIFGGSMGAYLLGVARWTFASFWGVFDSMQLFWGRNPLGRPPSPAAGLPPIYNALAAVSILSVIGLVSIFRRNFMRLSTTQAAIIQTMLALIVLTWLSHLRFVLVFFQAQGRYWYPALIPLAMLFVLGWRGILPKPRSFVVGMIIMGLALIGLNLYTLFGLLLPRFAGS